MFMGLSTGKLLLCGFLPVYMTLCSQYIIQSDHEKFLCSIIIFPKHFTTQLQILTKLREKTFEKNMEKEMLATTIFFFSNIVFILSVTNFNLHSICCMKCFSYRQVKILLSDKGLSNLLCIGFARNYLTVLTSVNSV